MERVLLEKVLTSHLDEWGLRRFTSDEAYFHWQRQILSPQELSDLRHLVERKRSGQPADEMAFYDLTAGVSILPVLYSQRYDYYRVVGTLVAGRFGDAPSVLDFGCGVGILTTFYAKAYPGKIFVGVDRSPASIAQAERNAKRFGLNNVRFECIDADHEGFPGRYECILATHALVQAEQDSGIPSKDWTTFERDRDVHLQEDFETRTGIGTRLDRLCTALAPAGRMIVFEKTRQLARRIPFQRALAARGLALIEHPEPVRYQTVEEVSDDGPLYVISKAEAGTVPWDETPEPDEGRPFDRTAPRATSNDPDTPLYENHWPSAQREWEQLKGRSVIVETTRQEPDGRCVHVETGTAENLVYLYCSNTFDQRQLLIVEPSRRAMLDAYYQEIIAGLG